MNRAAPLLSLLTRTRTLVALLLLAAFTTVLICYVSITRNAGQITNNPHTFLLLTTLGIFSLIFAAIVIRRAMRLWTSLKSGSAGSRLQTRLVTVFSITAILPTVVVSVFSAFFFNLGIQTWFDDRVSTALEESERVAQSYIEEHKYTIRGDAMAMAGDIAHDLEYGTPTAQEINNILNTQVALRSLSEAVLFQPGHIIAQSRLSFSLAFEQIPASDLEIAERGDVVVKLEGTDKVRALIKLHSVYAPNTYLLVGRLIDNKVINYMDTANGSYQQYLRLKENITAKQVQFFIVFIVLAMLLLFAAVWYGMYFASRLIHPITRLVKAAERVRAGDFTATVAEGPKNDEIATLSRAFNRMTAELERQRGDLIEANRQLDTRRRFSEAVLSGVSAGIVALTREKVVTLANPVAANLLLVPQDTALRGRLITGIVPEFAEIFNRAEANPEMLCQDKITITREDKSHVLHVRLSVERFQGKIDGYILTFDDITELLVAQRSAAWADVARRVAHEIKNPLTPIQLSTERLRKKYLPQIVSDTENYVKYLDTIARHIGDIGRIVEEFVTFARMPAPSIKSEDITSVIRKAVFSEQTAHTDITYHLDLPASPLYILCDEQQFSRVLLNILKNAAEAMENIPELKGIITVQCQQENGLCKLRISDNGPGFPPDKMTRLLEPYVTTRAKGTGLGLAIVKKIIDDHKAQLSLENLPEGGACVTITLPVYSDKNVT
ncbi:MAG TPA: PAS domain-containing sensor histidine kinase [Rickettsiales bacterium]|nr:PAS domain-containing sensor histidine kinase [Rickettsiales bacterium]